jgi:hypothetical protein
MGLSIEEPQQSLLFADYFEGCEPTFAKLSSLVQRIGEVDFDLSERNALYFASRKESLAVLF